jgi:hypothetical protein
MLQVEIIILVVAEVVVITQLENQLEVEALALSFSAMLKPLPPLMAFMFLPTQVNS